MGLARLEGVVGRTPRFSATMPTAMKASGMKWECWLNKNFMPLSSSSLRVVHTVQVLLN